MEQVIDPEILKQLEGSNSLMPVTDPNILAQLEGGQAQSATPTQLPSKPLGGNRALDIGAGIFETPLTLATGGIANIAGLTSSIGAGIIGKSPEEAKKIRESVTNALTYQPQSESAKGAMGLVNTALYPLSLPRKAGEALGGEQWGNVGESAMLALLPKAVPTGVKIAEKVGGYVAEKSMPLTMKYKSTQVLSDTLDKIIDEGVNKGIKPYIGKKTTYGKMQAYDVQANSAIRDIINNKNQQVFDRNGQIVVGELPKSLSDLSQAVENGMDRIVNQYTDIAKTATGKGIKVNVAGAGSVLDSLVTDEMKVARPEIAGFAEDLKGRLSEYKNGQATPLEVQDLIKELNVTAKQFYRDPTTASKGLVYETLARKLREANATALESLGPKWQSLRKQYGDYASIEKDINRRWQVSKRANKYGFFDIANIGTGVELARAVINLDPAAAGSAIGMQLIKNRMKVLNSPDYNITKMFRTSENIMDELNRR